MVAFTAGVAVAGLLAFGWWFGLMKLNQWIPMLNLIAPVAGLAVVPAVLCVRFARVRPAIAYAIGSWSFVGWSVTAVHRDPFGSGVPRRRRGVGLPRHTCLSKPLDRPC